MKKEEKLILIDGNALVHRAYHALPPLSQKGEPTNAVYGFTSVLLKVLRELKPDYMAAAFDLPAPTFRHEEFAEYKAHRPKTPDDLVSQFPKVKEVLAAFGIPVFEKAGFEADDIIGTIAEKVKGHAPNVRCVIITGDLDTLQLVDGNTEVYTLKKGITETVIYDEKGTRERFGGLAPEQLNDFKGLKGDPSDNIPGVPGIGEKTAVKLISEYGSLEKMYENIALVAPQKLREKLEEHKDQAFFSKKLATIRRDAPVDFDLERAAFGAYDADKAEEVFRKFGFTTLIQRMKNSKQEKEEEAVVSPAVSPAAPLDRVSVEKLKKAPRLAVWLEESRLYLASDPEHFCECAPSEVKDILEDGQVKKIGYDLKPAIKQLAEQGIALEGVYFDAQIAAYLLAPGEAEYPFEEIARTHLRRKIPPGDLPARAPVYLLDLYQKLDDKMAQESVAKVFYDIEMPLLPVLARMEEWGVKADRRQIADLSNILGGHIAQLEKRVWKLAGEEFNLDSPSQLSKILFEKLGIAGDRKNKKTKTGIFTTRAEVLEELKDKHEIIPLILEYRELAKLKNTYVDALGDYVADDGRVHTVFLQTGTATGRLSSRNPNMQNVPQRGVYAREMRDVFVADEWWTLAAFDFSQIELRIIASLSGDKKMIDIFQSGGDIHRATAAAVNHVPLERVTAEMRNAAKALNFGILYGMGQRAFARAAGIDAKTAQKFIEEYFRDFEGIAAFIEKTKKEARRDGFVRTLLGRKRWLPDINSSNAFLRQAAERMAQNMPIQGLQADIIKLATAAIDREVLSKNNNVRLLLQIHDELVFEIRNESLDSACAQIKDIMESSFALKVPIAVNVRVGASLGEMKHYGN